MKNLLGVPIPMVEFRPQWGIYVLSACSLMYGQQPQAPVPAPPDRAPESPYIEDGGISVQPWYWMISARPLVRDGKLRSASKPGDFDFPGKSRGAFGVTFSVPAGKQNSLRFSYFRATGSGNTVATADLALFSIGYTTGDVLTTTYKIENVKVSWDFLTYTFGKNVRVKTLWEGQATGFNTEVNAPLKATASGTSYLANGKKWLFYPTFGLGLEQAMSSHFRWEAKGSGFGLPHRGSLGDVEASAVLRLGRIEVLGGYKYFSVKTSPKAEAYFRQTLHGPYAGVRWYFDRMK
jgi:hypothetical protein